jgi:putative transposase
MPAGRRFRAILASTPACAGKRVAAVPAHFTSQECSGGGDRAQKSRSVRTPVCPSCGLVLDRDANAAVNILRAGQAPQARTPSAEAYVAGASPAVTRGECQTILISTDSHIHVRICP